LTREFWQSAAEALDSADIVSLVGYSIPSTDLVGSGMLAERLAGKSTRVEVVNPSAEPVVERLKLLGVHEDSIHVVGGDAAVAHFADAIERETSQYTLTSLLARSGNPLLLVAVDDVRMASVTGIDTRDSTVRLIAEPLSDLNHATRPLDGRDDPPLGLEELRAAILSRSADNLVAVLDSFECPIIDHQTPDAFIRAGQPPDWLVLVPSAAPTGGVEGVPVGVSR
jgi:hypothetical protein